METLLDKALGISLIIFMIGSLLEIGLKLRIDDAWRALRNVRFVIQSLLWAFVLCPALAILLTKIIPLSKAYADGMLFLGMAPCAPFFPLAAQKARGDLAYVAALVLLTAVGTVLYMPFLTPVLIPGFNADAWAIAKPLLFFILTPMVAGMAIRHSATAFADRFHPFCRKVTVMSILVMFSLVLWIYRTDLVGMVGTYAIGTQFLYYALVTIAAYGLGFGLPHSQRSVLALGVSTRNIGAAIAPLLAVPGTDQHMIVMAVMAAPITLICAFGAAPLLARIDLANKPDKA